MNSKEQDCEIDTFRKEGPENTTWQPWNLAALILCKRNNS